ncbi:MAG: HNH endonuclease [Gemmatimonadota bacterium]
MTRKAPLVYLRGIVPGRYLPEWPVFVVGDDPAGLTFHVSIDDHTVFGQSDSMFGDEGAEARRAYVTVQARQRLHQARFRERVLRAYRECCAICRLRHRELLDATHILPDKHPLGEPVISNGLSLCKLHHAAYDQHILGIRPDLRIDVRMDILEEIDGPMLEHGLQGFQGQRLVTPRRSEDLPNPDFLAERYELFRRAS